MPLRIRETTSCALSGFTLFLHPAAITVPIYARVNSGGLVLPAGAYTDTVQVTLSW